MHHLITAAASLMILTLFIVQFAANESLFIETLAIERTINACLEKEYEESEVEKGLSDLGRELDKIPNVSAEVRGNELFIRIDGIIAPSAIMRKEDNHIILKKTADLKIRGEKDEKSDNNGGNSDTDGTAE